MTTVTQTQQLLDLELEKAKTNELLRANEIVSLVEQTVEHCNRLKFRPKFAFDGNLPNKIEFDCHPVEREHKGC